MQELGNQYNINIKLREAHSPWLNGLNKHNHATIDIMMKKMLEDFHNVHEETGRQYAVCCIFSSLLIQVAIRQNPRLPSTFQDSLPVLEGCTTSSTIAQDLNAIAAAWKTSVHRETSAKVRKALKHSVRQYCDAVLKPNDNVFTKLPTD